MTRIELDVKKLEEKDSAHAYLKEKFSFPEYYGRNLDALHDCLTELDDTTVILRGAECASQQAMRFLRVFEDSADENSRLFIIRPGDYDLIALDMDGTCLTTDKRIDEVTADAIHHALRRGKEVVFCTGRPVAEMRHLLRDYPDMRYLLCESGALLYDLKEEKALYRKSMSREAVEALRITAAGRDVCPVVFADGEYYIGAGQVHHMDRYQMGEFQEFVLGISNQVDDVFAYVEREGIEPDKTNLFHPSPAERALSRRILREKCPDALAEMTMADTEIASLECTAPGVDKGFGLRALADITGIPTRRMIMVGDGDNDLEGLEAAGLAVAMANANEHVKAVSQAEVADNDHWGCAQAICRYLLGVG